MKVYYSALLLLALASLGPAVATTSGGANDDDSPGELRPSSSSSSLRLPAGKALKPGTTTGVLAPQYDEGGLSLRDAYRTATEEDTRVSLSVKLQIDAAQRRLATGQAEEDALSDLAQKTAVLPKMVTKATVEAKKLRGILPEKAAGDEDEPLLVDRSLVVKENDKQYGEVYHHDGGAEDAPAEGNRKLFSINLPGGCFTCGRGNLYNYCGSVEYTYHDECKSGLVCDTSSKPINYPAEGYCKTHCGSWSDGKSSTDEYCVCVSPESQKLTMMKNDQLIYACDRPETCPSLSDGEASANVDCVCASPKSKKLTMLPAQATVEVTTYACVLPNYSDTPCSINKNDCDPYNNNSHCKCIKSDVLPFECLKNGCIPQTGSVNDKPCALGIHSLCASGNCQMGLTPSGSYYDSRLATCAPK